MNCPYPKPAQKGRLHWEGKSVPTELPASPVTCLEEFGDTRHRSNLLFSGDNAKAITHLLKNGYENKVQLVYIDPPFCSGTNYKRTLRLRGSSSKKDPRGTEIGHQVQYTDAWSEDQYLQFCYERLLLLRALLCDTGSLILHVDEHMSHMLRCMMDEVFGREAFVNEIVWHYPDNFQGNVRGLANNHNLLFWYSKTPNYKAFPVKVPLKAPKKRDRRVWSKEEKKVVAARDEAGKIIYDTYTHKKADDVWTIGQSSVSKIRSHEHLGYPTQKPELLLQRILEATTEPGDIVVDVFSGSGTTAGVAQKLGRQWICCDKNPVSIQKTAQRTTGIIQQQNSTVKAQKIGGIEIQDSDFKGIQILGVEDRKNPIRPGEILVDIEREGSLLEIEINGIKCDSLFGEIKTNIHDWKQVVDSIRIDPNYDGETFRPTHWDTPREPEQVSGKYALHHDELGAVLAMRLVDVLGGEISYQIDLSKIDT